MFKRRAFEHESEVRLIYVGSNPSENEMLCRPWDHDAVIDAIALDPPLDHQSRVRQTPRSW